MKQIAPVGFLFATIGDHDGAKRRKTDRQAKWKAAQAYEGMQGF